VGDVFGPTTATGGMSLSSCGLMMTVRATTSTIASLPLARLRARDASAMPRATGSRHLHRKSLRTRRIIGLTVARDSTLRRRHSSGKPTGQGFGAAGLR
jgi:hypothetical protein